MKLRMALKFTVLAVMLAAQTGVAGSLPVQPRPIVPGDRCARCQRLIANRWVATETIAADRTAFKFRTVRCMLTYLTDHPQMFERLVVADDQSGGFVDVEDAVYVPVSIDRHTGIRNYGIGEKDYVAFRSPRVAERFAADHGVKTMTWLAVVVESAFLSPGPQKVNAR